MINNPSNSCSRSRHDNCLHAGSICQTVDAFNLKKAVNFQSRRVLLYMQIQGIYVNDVIKRRNTNEMINCALSIVRPTKTLPPTVLSIKKILNSVWSAYSRFTS